jgi:hypothetical protein
MFILVFTKIFVKQFCFKLIFFSVFGLFWCANIKNKLKKYYFDAFSSEKHFEQQLLAHSQTGPPIVPRCKRQIQKKCSYNYPKQ